MMYKIFPGLLLSLSACTPFGGPNFSSIGQNNVNSSLGEDLSDDADTGADTGISISKDAPTILYTSAEFDAEAKTILLTIGFSDPQDDVQGGSVYCQFSINKKDMSDCLGDSGNLIPIDGKVASISTDKKDSDIVELQLSLTQDGNSYEFDLGLIDIEGNQSETTSTPAK